MSALNSVDEFSLHMEPGNVGTMQFTTTKTAKSRCIGLLKQVVLLLILSALSYLLIQRYFVRSVHVEGASMSPTLQDGERYLMNCRAYRGNKPKRGDLVVIRLPGQKDPVVKRIVGMPSEAVLLKRGQIYINSEKLDEAYLPENTQTYPEEGWEKLVIVGQERYFVLGDNRKNSQDSRDFGAVPLAQILGTIDP